MRTRVQKCQTSLSLLRTIVPSCPPFNAAVSSSSADILSFLSCLFCSFVPGQKDAEHLSIIPKNLSRKHSRATQKRLLDAGFFGQQEQEQKQKTDRKCVLCGIRIDERKLQMRYDKG